MDWTLVQYALPLFIVVVGLESRSLSMVGATSALLVAYIIFITQSVLWFAVMFAFFIIGTAATRYKEERKEKLKLLQKVRGSKNVMSNGGIAMLMAVLGGPAGMYGFIGALAAAASDTASSEIGVTSRERPFMITDFSPARTGMNGAISFFGTFYGFLAALAIGIVSLAILPEFKAVVIAVVAGMLGNFADSYFGALFENRGWWGNSTTNMLATTVGAIFGIIIGVLI
ncbi:DUF92 domain-containing protein [Candidatus Micrarchaeota archaeon]|nr:DUF92 domain-containing protein [Candidatus Micrarchaeota archaeon]